MCPLQGLWIENCAVNKGKPPNKKLAKIKVFNDLERYKKIYRTPIIFNVLFLCRYTKNT